MQKRLIKQSEIIYLKDLFDSENINTDKHSREFAFVFINGETYEGNTHKQIIDNNLDKVDKSSEVAFGSCVKDKDGDFLMVIYPETIENCSLNDVVYDMKFDYPNCIFCTSSENYIFDNYNDFDKNDYLTVISNYKRLINTAQKIYLKDILDDEYLEDIGIHSDSGIREFAFAYINGEIFTGDIHSNILIEYRNEYGVYPEEVAFGSYLIDKNGINYAIIYPETLENVNINTLIDTLKYEYKNAVICTSNESYSFDWLNESNENNYLNVVGKKRLKKLCEKIYLKDILSPKGIEYYGENTDYGNRDFAIAYIDGNIYEGDVHKDIIDKYIQDNDLDVELNHSEGFVQDYEQEELGESTAFASYIKGIDGNNYIAIYPDSVFGVNINDFIKKLESKYNNVIICYDNNNRYDNINGAYIETI